jgi:serine/threonine protein kinase
LENNLQTLLEHRRETKEPFTEGELLLIADDLITALSYFQSQGISHGDIRPFNIFYKDQIYKLNDPSLNAQKNANGLTQAIVHGTKTYLAPELIPQVPQQKFEVTTDKYKADVYSLGVTLLSLATLTNSEDLYDYEKGTVNETLIRERLNNVSQNYSKFTHDLIEDMLIPQEAERPDSIQVSNKVTPPRNT